MHRRVVRTFAASLLALALLPVGSGTALAGGGACHGGTPPTEGTGSTVELSRACFSPTVLRVEPGTRVTFVNRDPFEHDVTGANGAWSSGKLLRSGDSFSVTFDGDGTYPFSCYLHPGMTGVIAVGDANATMEGASSVSVAPASDVGNLEPAGAEETGAAANADRATGEAAGLAWWVVAFGSLLGLGAGTGIGLIVRRRSLA